MRVEIQKNELDVIGKLHGVIPRREKEISKINADFNEQKIKRGEKITKYVHNRNKNQREDILNSKEQIKKYSDDILKKEKDIAEKHAKMIEERDRFGMSSINTRTGEENARRADDKFN